MESGAPVQTSGKRRRQASRIFQIVAFTALSLAALFGGAGRLDWTRGWIYFATYAVGMTAAAVVVQRANPSVVEARANWRHKDTKAFDRVFLLVYLVLYFVQPALAGMDSVRFGWSSIPFGAVYPGIALFGLSTTLITWVLVVNPFAESTVRIQTDRGHTVVSSGPYRFVRHPMYVGAILMYLATPLLLGSLWALALSVLICGLFVVRTALEDRTLRRELPGYEAFSARTRYRLVPGVW